MNALEITELPDVVVNENTLIPVVNPDGAGRASLVNLRGLGIQNQETFFLVSSKNSGITSATAGWVETPEVTSSTNKYLWSYFKFTYTDGHVVETPPAIIGTHGEKGDAGTSDGTGGTSVTVDTDLSETSENPVQNKVITGAIGTLSDLTTTNKGNLVEAINEINANGGGSGGGTTGIVSQFTYVVDSDQALQDWADNVKENDYTNVLIKKGTWTISKRINLSSTNTKTVFGEGGSKLVFRDEVGGFIYNDNDEESLSDRWIKGVTIELVNTNLTSSLKAFDKCVNLTNCFSTINSIGEADGFLNCINLVNCRAKSIVTGTDTDTSTRIVRGFRNCDRLVNCTSVAEGSNNTNYGSAFSNCTNLTNCKGNSKGYLRAYAFQSCKGVTNCHGETYAESVNTKETITVAFSSCENVTNCIGISNAHTDASLGVGKAFAFRSCKGVTNCQGQGVGTAGRAFIECFGVRGCRKYDTSTSSVFFNSYASFSNNTAYVPADTPEGGFNDPTN